MALVLTIRCQIHGSVSQTSPDGCRLCDAERRQRDLDAVLRDLADVDSLRIMRAEIDTLRTMLVRSKADELRYWTDVLAATKAGV